MTKWDTVWMMNQMRYCVNDEPNVALCECDDEESNVTLCECDD